MRRKRPKEFKADPFQHSRLRRKWRTWLSDIQADLSDLLGRREIFWELQEVAKENPKVLQPGAFFDWMCRNYFAAAVMVVRGLLDHRNDVQSLWRIIYEILENPKVINRRSHRALYRGIPANRNFDMANLTFDGIAGKGQNVLRQRDIRRDLRDLEDSSERIRMFANKRVAHRAADGELRRNPKLNELDAAIDTIDRIFCKYNLALTASGMTSVFATRQYDWMQVLHEPWVTPGSKFRPNHARIDPDH